MESLEPRREDLAVTAGGLGDSSREFPEQIIDEKDGRQEYSRHTDSKREGVEIRK